MELMLTVKNTGCPAWPWEAAARLPGAIGDLIAQGQQAGTLPPGGPYRVQLLFGAT